MSTGQKRAAAQPPQTGGPARPLSRHGAAIRGLDSTPHSPLFQGRFGRMFRQLPSAKFGSSDTESEANLAALAKSMVAAADPAKDAVDDEESGIPALYTYFGQFIDHDITFDPSSSLQKQNDPNALTDFRTPAFDLDNVYGRGPDDQPYMYDGDKLLLGSKLTGAGVADAFDLPRASNGRALIGDPRNDENSIVSQLQGLLHRFHNRTVQDNPGLSFADVQQRVRFHYQFVVLNDFLPRIVHSSVLNQLKTNGQFDRHKIQFYHFKNDPFMPVEFSGAAYRFGHSMVRPGYRLNNDDATLLDIFPGLTGFQPMGAGRAIDWGRFIDVDTRPYGSDVQPPNADTKRRLQFAYRIDTSLVDPLGNLPPAVASNPSSLAERNLKRGFRLGLPSGQAVAKAIGVTPLTDAQIIIGKATATADPDAKPIVDAVNANGGNGSAFAGNCPLWTYILAEAARNQENVNIPVTPATTISTPRLGPVGGRIVAEVFLGLMFGDGNSLLSLDPGWQPASNPNFKLKDLVNYALGN